MLAIAPLHDSVDSCDGSQGIPLVSAVESRSPSLPGEDCQRLSHGWLAAIGVSSCGHHGADTEGLFLCPC